jgi:hypothetical protein
MMKQRVIRTASFSIFFLLSGFALVHAQVPPPDPTEPPSRLSMFVHDVTNWADHIITDAKHTIKTLSKRRANAATPFNASPNIRLNGPMVG